MRLLTGAAMGAAVLFWCITAHAVINKPISLKDDALREEFIFHASIELIDADKPIAVFKVDEHLKGKIPIEKMVVNLTGSEEAKKANHRQILLDRMEVGRTLIVFCSSRGKRYFAIAFMEGTWFSVQGTLDTDGKTIRWAFMNCEPNLRGTFKGSTAELKTILEDAIHKKIDPPAPNFKEPPGYGPPIMKKPEESSDDRFDSRGRSVITGGPLFGAIPSLALIAPMAIIAALFPGIAARMAIGMKKWRAFLVIAGMNSTLAVIYFFVSKYLPNTVYFSLTAFTTYLLTINFIGLVWAGRRYRKLAAHDATMTNTPSRVELLTLLGLSVVTMAMVASTRFFAPWSAIFELPMREITFISAGLLCATVYSAYRALTPSLDRSVDGGLPPLRLSISGESIGLGTVFLCGFAAVLLSINNGESRTVLDIPDSGELKLTTISTYRIPDADQVMSGIVISGDRLYFGTSTLRLTFQAGSLVCLDRTTGQVMWNYEGDDDLLAVFCTPTVANGRVYFGEGLHEHKKCRFFCLDANSGKPAWEKPLQTGSHTEGTPLVVDDRVYFTAGDDGLYCVDARTGASLWSEPFGGASKKLHIDGPPAIANQRIFAGSGLYTKAVFAIDAISGSELWRTAIPYRSFGKPLVMDGRVFFGIGTGNILKDTEQYHEELDVDPETSPGGAVICVDASNGRIVWQYPLTHSVHTPLAADSMFIYTTSRDGFVHCLNRKTGRLRWKFPLGSPLTAGVAIAADEDGVTVAVYAVSTDGVVACLNPFTGRPYWVRDLRVLTGQLVKDVVSTPAVVTLGNMRSLYVGAMVENTNNKARAATIFRFDDVIE